jgi:hypothetical protein
MSTQITISPSLPYKVYTALLTQSGGDDPGSISSGPVTAGVTYKIVVSSLVEPWDFSNVGGPVYPETYTFVATASNVPNSWAGVDDLNYNNGAPVVTVLENTIGNIWFTYQGTGDYWINSNGLFTIDKTWGISENVYATTAGIIEPLVIDVSGQSGTSLPDNIDIRLQGGDFGGDSLLNKTPIEIRVYN